MIIKPCPFCGNKEPELKNDGHFNSIECKCLLSFGGCVRDMSYIIEKWNTRHENPFITRPMDKDVEIIKAFRLIVSIINERMPPIGNEETHMHELVKQIYKIENYSK